MFVKENFITASTAVNYGGCIGRMFSRLFKIKNGSLTRRNYYVEHTDILLVSKFQKLREMHLHFLVINHFKLLSKKNFHTQDRIQEADQNHHHSKTKSSHPCFNSLPCYILLMLVAIRDEEAVIHQVFLSFRNN